MPAPGVQAVDILGVKLIRPLEGVGQRGFPLRRDHEMDVIRHKAIALYA